MAALVTNFSGFEWAPFEGLGATEAELSTFLDATPFARQLLAEGLRLGALGGVHDPCARGVDRAIHLTDVDARIFSMPVQQRDFFLYI